MPYILPSGWSICYPPPFTGTRNNHCLEGDLKSFCEMIFVHVPNQLQTPWKKVHETMEMKKTTINSSQRCSGRYTGIVTISINQPHVGIYKSYSNIPVPMDPMERFTKKHANSFFFHQNSSDFPVKPPPPASNAPSRQGPVPPSQWRVKFLWGSPHEIRFTKWQRGVSEILERRNHLCGVQPTSWRKLVGWFTVSLFLFWKMMLL